MAALIFRQVKIWPETFGEEEGKRGDQEASTSCRQVMALSTLDAYSISPTQGRLC